MEYNTTINTNKKELQYLQATFQKQFQLKKNPQKQKQIEE